MPKGISKGKLAGLLLAGIIAVTGTISAFASALPVGAQGSPGNRPSHANMEARTAAVEAAMKKLVEAGTITQTQADEIVKIYKPAERRNPMDELVSAGTITQSQADTIIKEMKSMTDVLKELVTAGTITQEQSDAVVKAFSPWGRKDMYRNTGKSPTEQLVAAGTITQAQLDSIMTAIMEGRKAKKSTADVLKELVTAGTITKEQSDAVEKVVDPGFRRNMKQNYIKSPLDHMVKAGTITQAQADAVNAAIKAAFDELKQQ